MVAAINAIAEGGIDVMPRVLVTGGGGGALDGLAATLMNSLREGGRISPRKDVGALADFVDPTKPAAAGSTTAASSALLLLTVSPPRAP